ncbi:hypothetical protein BWD13_13090 [Leptospira santarosai serovar Grippotyphosa]|nr:PF07119 family protein [Leptospira santarosai]ONF85522.1 hypothetical protein BWD13_13090 [Leptospira santarosai serovar Grippotyphosa]
MKNKNDKPICRKELQNLRFDSRDFGSDPTKFDLEKNSPLEFEKSFLSFCKTDRVSKKILSYKHCGKYKPGSFMFSKILLSVLIVLQFGCNTTAAIVYSFESKKKGYLPYSGISLSINRFIWETHPPKPFSTSIWRPLILIDLPFTFVLDTVLLPISFPYYVYVESGRPWSEEWYYKKWKKRLYTFMAKNSSSDILSLSLTVAKTDYPLYGDLLKAVLYLEKKILRLQQDGFTLNKDLEYLMSVSSNGTMGAESQLKQHIEIVSIAYEQLREYPELKDSYNEKFWKQYFEIVWRNYFSKGTLIHPDVLKKVLHEFSDRKDAEILFKEIAFFYSKQEYALQTSYSPYFNDLDEDLSLSGFSPESRSILGLPTTNREFWKNRIQILMELDRMVRKEFPNLKKSFDPVWTEAISSGVVSYYHPALEKAFQEFPKETKTSVGNLFKKAVDSNNPYSIEVIGKYVSDLNAFFASDQKMIRTVLRSPNILEKLLQAGLDPNRTYGIEDTFLILCLEDNEETSVNSLRLLLKYGAKTNLPVGRYSRGKEYLRNSNADPDFTSSDSFLKKRKILTEWMKKQP